jgi:hypothetical protein
MTIKVYQKGELVRIEGLFTDIEGTLADPTTVTLKVTPPSGVTVAYTYAGAQVIRDSVGAFHYDLNAPDAGQWFYRWEATGAASQAADNGEFMVEPSSFVVA